MVRTPGKAYLMGTGLGEPRFVSVRGRDVLSGADRVVAPKESAAFVARLVGPKTERIYVKSPGPLGESELDELIVDPVREGRRVVRLVTGDPLLFGPGGPEWARIAKAGVPVEVIPGGTPPVLAPAFAGLPMTLPGETAVTLIDARSGALAGVQGRQVADSRQTLALWVETDRLRPVVDALLAEGRSPASPVVLTVDAGTPRQISVRAPLKRLVNAAREEGLRGVGVLVSGESAGLAKRLDWWERRPLHGRRIVVTRPRAQAMGLVDRLAELGAEPLLVPTIRIEPPPDPETLDDAVRQAGSFDWVVFTSVNGVNVFMGRLMALRVDIRSLAGVRIAAIGTATARALSDRGLIVDVIPSRYQAEDLVDALVKEGIRGASILVPRALEARDVLIEGLRKEGARVHEVAAYVSVRESVSPEVLDFLREGTIDALTFTSSSIVRNFARIVREHGLPWPPEAASFCIGPITARTARDEGLLVKGVAEEYTTDGLIRLILEHLAQHPETEV